MNIARNDPEISVIMIFLNAEEFIEEAIESVFRQSFDRWELLLVDDGSTDGSTAIAGRFAGLHPGRVRYLEHPGHLNRGMSASRNLGIAHARGEYIAFLDADDLWLPERLERHRAVLEEHDEVGMVYGPTLYWYSWSPANRHPDAPQDHVTDLALEPGCPIAAPQALLTYLETGGSSLPGICSLLARRKLVERVGAFEDCFRSLYEDQVFLSKMTLHAPVYVFPELLDKYRQHPNSSCQQAILRGEYDLERPNPARGRYLRWLERYFAAQNGIDERLVSALQFELWPYRNPRFYAFLQSEAVSRIKQVVRRTLPPPVYAWLRRQLRRQSELGDKSWSSCICVSSPFLRSKSPGEPAS
jgi:glycosyltransferase involved in cell wall biosynthesis